MMNDPHEQTKLGLVIDILLITEENERFIHKSRDISTHKVVLEHNADNNKLAVGSIVDLQVCCLAENEEAQIVQSEVTRLSDDGVELRFIL